jgi:hypothetical protein
MPTAADSSRPRSDTIKPVPDTIRPRADSLLTDSLNRILDSLRHPTDSLKRRPDSTRSLSDELQHSMDSLRKATASPQSSPGMPGASPSSSRSPGFPGFSPGASVARQSSQGPRPPPRNVKTTPQSNQHRKYIPIKSGVIPIDSFSLVPNAFFIRDVADSDYTLDWVNATISWKIHPPGPDSVLVVYRTFPYKFNAVARRFNYDSIENYFLVQPYVFNNGSRQDEDNFFNFGNITYNGSFGRSITFGNSQDAVVTSNLNLQISGYLADSIQISAAITDNNIPIQPDGTTANLNEFDKIYLEFKKKGWDLTMGDIDLRQNQNYFLRFYKRLQGMSFATDEQLSKNVTNHSLVSAAIAKGKFTRNIFQGQEGNQGPYQLQGANNELYFIVLAGTEKVFIDGQLMQRGQDQDYVINYNTAEVTFTANRMITQDARIQVEFEYADRNYLNVNLYLADELEIDKKLKLRVGVFSNSDARNSPINQSLTPAQIAFLSGLGDSIQRAFYPVAALDTFAAGKILYNKIDTTYTNGSSVVHDSIYVFAAAPAPTQYNLVFTNVGQGYGNYVPDLNGVNGNVYMWIAPVNGQMQGSYEAAQFLVTPKTQRVVTVGADYAMNKNTTMSAEVASSHYDVNTLSSIGKNNDNGYAAKFQFTNTQKVGVASQALQLTSNMGYEYVQASFQPLETLRPVEFTRDWGLALAVTPATEKIYTGGLMLADKKLNSIKYEIARYERSDGFTGTRNIITQKQELLGWHIKDQLSYTTSDSTGAKGFYFRPSIDVSRAFPSLKNYLVGASFAVDHNENHDVKADTVLSNSFAYHTLQIYLKSPEKNPDHWGMTFSTRVNSYPYANYLAAGDKSKTMNLFVDLLRNPHHVLRFNATYRNLAITNTRITTQTADNSLLGRAEYLVNEWKGLLKGSVLYEIGSGQQQKQSYTYLQVPAGTGQYAWIDYNKDGIQQLNEFVLAQFPDQAQYIRVYTPTDEYIKANYNTFNYSFVLTPKMLVTPKSSDFHKFLGRIILQSSLQLTQKAEAQGFVQLNPFKTPLDDTSLISRSLIAVNTVSFNRSDPNWGFDVSNTQNDAKTLLTYGLEAKALSQWTLHTRINVARSIVFNTTIQQGTNQLSNSSSNFDSSNYNLQQFSAEPNITYTRGSNFRLAIGYKLSSKQNTPDLGNQRYTAGSFNSEFKYNILQSTSIQSKFTYTDITYLIKGGGGPASTTSPVSYTMLEGLNPGKNYLWGIDFTKKLGASLEISLQYEGRKAAETGVVNTGRASLRALL